MDKVTHIDKRSIREKGTEIKSLTNTDTLSQTQTISHTHTHTHTHTHSKV